LRRYIDPSFEHVIIDPEVQDGALRAVVIAPTFNNSRTLGDILARIAALGLPIIVVNDGSTDGTADLLTGDKSLTVITHPRNRGKAAALNTGFAAAIEAGFTHAITIDTDGQLDPEEIPTLLDAARRHPEALIVGRRKDRIDGYPTRSRMGRRVSNLLVRLESGVRVDDSQCGFRVYPLGLIAAVKCNVGHYGFETEVITRAGWAGCAVEQVPVTCRYLPSGQRVSHFRPCLDTLRAARMHLGLLGRALFPFPRHPQWPDTAPRATEPFWSGLWNWLNPARAWRQLRQSEVARTEIAAGLAVGVFIANLPAYGLQSVLSLYTARRLHLHPLPVFLGSNLSTPPIGPLLVIAAIHLGHLLLHGSLAAVADFDPRRAGWSAMLGPRLLEWSIGALLLGFVMSVLTFVVTLSLMRFFGERKVANDVAQADCSTATAAATDGASA
jgi:glycosyltransferase involved in cell wall biosynthesis